MIPISHIDLLKPLLIASFAKFGILSQNLKTKLKGRPHDIVSAVFIWMMVTNRISQKIETVIVGKDVGLYIY